MDFGQGDGGFGAGERTMSNLLSELGGEHRQRSNNSNHGGGSDLGGLSMSPMLSHGSKTCRSVSEMDFCKSRDGDNHDRGAGGEGQGPLKLARTDAFPFDLKMHNHYQQQQQQMLRSSSNNSMASEGRVGYSPTNSSDGGGLFKSDVVSVVSVPGLYADSSAVTRSGGGHSLMHQQQQQQCYYPFKGAGLPLSMGREAVNHTAMGIGMGMHGGVVPVGSRFCFTQAQWQELEHQALIFKYMMASVPVPPELLMPIRKSVSELTSLSALSAPGSHHHHHPAVGWSSFNLRFANNTDPEPGRCRRTDGKKWRCSRDVAPDQKYCERHMHRGRPRSRKLVEGQTAISSTASNNTTNNNSANATTQALGGSNSTATNAASSISLAAGRSSTAAGFTRPPFSMNAQQQNHSQTGGSTFGMKAFSNCGSGGGMSINGVSGGQFKPPLHMVSAAASAMANKDYRYMNWMKGDMDEQILFSEANSGKCPSQDSQSMSSLAMLTSVNNAWRLMPSKVPDTKLNPSASNSSSSLLQYTAPQLRTLLGQDFSLMPDTNQINMPIQEHHHQQQQHSFLSPGFGAGDSVNVGRDQSSQGQPLRHFIDDWPRSRDPSTLSWSDMEERTNSSNTQLSISLPMTITDFPGTNSGSPRGKVSLSSLKLSMSAGRSAAEDDPLGVDPTQMGLGVGMGLGLMNEDRHHRQRSNWIPVTWQSPVGGPLAEVLQSSANAGGTPRGCKASGLNLMSDGWDLSPHGSPRMASPTGVLQKSFASPSDSSSGSSPRAVAAAAAAAKHETPLQQNLGGV